MCLLLTNCRKYTCVAAAPPHCLQSSSSPVPLPLHAQQGGIQCTMACASGALGHQPPAGSACRHQQGLSRTDNCVACASPLRPTAKNAGHVSRWPAWPLQSPSPHDWPPSAALPHAHSCCRTQTHAGFMRALALPQPGCWSQETGDWTRSAACSTLPPRRAHTLLKMMLELCPPKPNELDSATSTLCCTLAPPTTISRSTSSSGLSRLMFGWSVPARRNGRRQGHQAREPIALGDDTCARMAADPAAMPDAHMQLQHLASATELSRELSACTAACACAAADGLPPINGAAAAAPALPRTAKITQRGHHRQPAP